MASSSRKKEEKNLQEPKCCGGTELGPQQGEAPDSEAPGKGVGETGPDPSVIFGSSSGY